MAFTAPGLEIILTGILRDIRNLQPEADIGNDSDHYVRSAAVAAAIEGVYQKLAWLYRQIFPDTADEEELVHAAATRGVLLKSAVAATGLVTLSGSPEVELPMGSPIKHVASSELFLTLTRVTLDEEGNAIATVKAQSTGTTLNDLSGAMMLSSPPLGMDPNARFIDTTAGGENQETPESLLGRYLEVIQKPPAGGAEYDFRRWAKEVDGVADALVLPRRRGGGTVDIVITASNGVPSTEVIDACRAHIESVCSVIAHIWVYAPTIRTVDATALVELASGYTMAQVQAAAQTAYNALLGALKPMDILKRSQIEAMINNLAGVLDRSVTMPAGNVPASDGPNLIGWIRPGTITLSLLE